ncbi:MAG TPA: hypothetical protein PLB38_04235 [bacterium]|nr:hypothetical protein [bacterium]
MVSKNKKQTWREKILYYEVCPKGKVSGAFQRAYRWFLCSACILAVLLLVIYLYLFFFAHSLLQEGRLLKQTAQISETWPLDENTWRALIVDQKEAEKVLYLQPSGLNAVLMVGYDDNSKIYGLEYQPALVDDGRVVHASKVFTVPATSESLRPGMIIYLREMKDLENGLYAPEILIGGYDELSIPDLGL